MKHLLDEMAAADAEARAMYYPEEGNVTNNDVINTLKQAGFRVRVQHFRYYHLNRAGKLTKRAHLLPTQAPRAKLGRQLELMEPNGGSTKCLVLMSTVGSNVGRFAEGTARCDPLDPFNRSQGVRFALRDALLNLLASLPADEGRALTLLNRSIEQLEQVENEYQEDVRLRSTIAEKRHHDDEERWGAVRHMSKTAGAHQAHPAMSREERLVKVGAERERIETLRHPAATPEAIAIHAY